MCLLYLPIGMVMELAFNDGSGIAPATNNLINLGRINSEEM